MKEKADPRKGPPDLYKGKRKGSSFDLGPVRSSQNGKGARGPEIVELASEGSFTEKRSGPKEKKDLPGGPQNHRPSGDVREAWKRRTRMERERVCRDYQEKERESAAKAIERGEYTVPSKGVVPVLKELKGDGILQKRASFEQKKKQSRASWKEGKTVSACLNGADSR